MKNIILSNSDERISTYEFAFLSFLVMLIYIGALKKQKLTFGGANAALFVGNLMSIAGFEYLTIMASFFVSGENLLIIGSGGLPNIKNKAHNSSDCCQPPEPPC